MGRILRGIIYLAVLGAAALVGYAWIADLAPDTAERRQPVVLDAR
jgi:hypothetical protein